MVTAPTTKVTAGASVTRRATPKRVNEAITPVDFHIARRIALLRHSRGRTRKWLAEVLGISVNMMQKVEQADARCPASRLYEIGQALGAHPGYFYEGFAAGGQEVGAYTDSADAAPDMLDPRLQKWAVKFGALTRTQQYQITLTMRDMTQAARYRATVGLSEDADDEEIAAAG